MHTEITKMPRCRWCDKEPEFTPVVADTAVCQHCGAMQEPALRLAAPAGRKTLKVYLNPDDGLFIEVEKLDGAMARYTISPERLKKSGVLHQSPYPLNGKKLDTPL